MNHRPISDKLQKCPSSVEDSAEMSLFMLTPPGIDKRHKRLAKAFFCVLFNSNMVDVEGAEYRIRLYRLRDKAKVDWEDQAKRFGVLLHYAFTNRHKPKREPIYRSTAI